MAEEKVIKSGVLTIPRLLFLAVVGLIIALTVWRGGVWLTHRVLAHDARP